MTKSGTLPIKSRGTAAAGKSHRATFVLRKCNSSFRTRLTSMNDHVSDSLECFLESLTARCLTAVWLSDRSTAGESLPLQGGSFDSIRPKPPPLPGLATIYSILDQKKYLLVAAKTKSSSLPPIITPLRRPQTVICRPLLWTGILSLLLRGHSSCLHRLETASLSLILRTPTNAAPKTCRTP